MSVKKRNYLKEAEIERVDHIRAKIGSQVGPPKPVELPCCYEGIKQTFFIYVKQYITSYGRPMIRLTRIGSMVSLDSLYNFGRIPLTMGGNQRITWVGTKGSKWLDFHTWQYFREQVYNRDKGICQICHKPTRSYVCDHIIPLFKGGRDWWEDPTMSNFQTLCEACNKVKTKRDVSKPKKAKEMAKLIYIASLFEVPKDYSLEKFLALNDVKVSNAKP